MTYELFEIDEESRENLNEENHCIYDMTDSIIDYMNIAVDHYKELRKKSGNIWDK